MSDQTEQAGQQLDVSDLEIAALDEKAASPPAETSNEPAAAGPPSDSVVCVACGEANPIGLSWCEACGNDLSAEPKPACTACDEPAVEPDGYCHSCGHRQPVGRDHVTMVEGPVVGVSDRGKRHHHNEDAVAISGSATEAIIVVCDGVSSTPGSAEVSLAAVHAAAGALAMVETADSPTPGAVFDHDLVTAVSAAQAAAVDAADNADADELNPPSTTFVAAVAKLDSAADEVAISVAWLGDSRAYWVDRERAELLTEDHEIGGALTHWLGPDSGVYEPDIAHFRFSTLESSSGGMVMVCSDGLWRYFDSDVGEAAGPLLARLRGEGLTGLNLAEALVAFANGLGGHDNISVGLWPVGVGGQPMSEQEVADAIDQPASDAIEQTEVEQGVQAQT